MAKIYEESNYHCNHWNHIHIYMAIAIKINILIKAPKRPSYLTRSSSLYITNILQFYEIYITNYKKHKNCDIVIHIKRILLKNKKK